MNKQLHPQLAMLTLGTFYSVLKNCTININITNLVFKTRSDYRTIKKYVLLLMDANLLNKVENLYILSEDGTILLDLLERLKIEKKGL